MRSIDASRDLPYQFDRWIANRPDGGTVSDTLSESFGVSKTTVHKGAIGTGMLTGFALASRAKTPGGAVAGVLLTILLAKVAYDYVEAPRYNR